MKRTLYLSAHSVLEFDEVSILHSLGGYVFSPGAYVNPQNRGDHDLRPNIAGLEYDPEDLRLWHSLASPGIDNKARLTAEVVSRFDAIIVMHVPEWITANAGVFRKSGKPVIWRTIGQSIQRNEEQIKPFREEGWLKIVRYSPAEERIPGYIGGDAMIRFAKDPADWHGWRGDVSQVVSVAQDPIIRREHCGYDFLEYTTRPFARRLLGNGTEASGWGEGRVSYERLREALRESRVFFYTGTHPASYTLGFIEALMTGIPVVSVGPKHGNNERAFPNHRLFEVPDMLTNGVNGFASDDPLELRDFIAMLLRSQALASKVGAAGRQAAIALFGVDAIREQWRAFLDGL